MRLFEGLTWKGWLILTAIILMILYPKFGGNSYILHLFIIFFIWSIVASNWNLLNGYTGIISLGNVGFLALGAYTSGILAKSFGFSPWLSIPIGGLCTMIMVLLLIGLPALRLKGIYVALLTLMFADSLPAFLTQTRQYSGGGMGLHSVPPFWSGIERVHIYYICLAVFIVFHIIIYLVINSSTGKAFVALREAEDFAESLGISRFRERMKVFALSALLTGTAGGFYIHALGHISPSILAIEPFLMAIAMMQLGGMGTFFGPIFGAVVIIFGGEFLRLAGIFRLFFLGGLICVTILFFPGGIMQLLETIESWIKNKMQSIMPTAAASTTEANSKEISKSS
jgi:branched-chain amino acid transport system permease protein